MNAVCCKCGQLINRQSESCMAIPGNKGKKVCMTCHLEWERVKDAHWHEFLGKRKTLAGRGKNAAKLKGIQSV